MANSKKTETTRDKKAADFKNDKAATGGGKNKNGGGKSGSMAKGTGETTGSKGTGHSMH